jgi:hypothetical protein
MWKLSTLREQRQRQAFSQRELAALAGTTHSVRQAC